MTHDDIPTRRLVLRLIPPAALAAIAEGDVDEAARHLALKIPGDWIDMAPLARRRIAQLAEEPDYRPWALRAIALRETGEALGCINFHGCPAHHGMAGREACAEFGYTIFTRHRRQGYAEEAVRALMDWARQRGARHFIFSVAPGNAASQGFAAKLGARRIGVQIDEEDGPEDVLLLD